MIDLHLPNAESPGHANMDILSTADADSPILPGEFEVVTTRISYRWSCSTCLI
jgi:hypothetical protein